ncbi:MAG: hypothetical protein KA586_10535 [Candidatus Promineofilum sp.]|nr:hypothetical protein [Promineifilum sp.]
MDRPGRSDSLKRGLIWIASLIGTATCILVPLLFSQGSQDFPLPALYFIEIALLGVLVMGYVVFRASFGGRWRALPWVASGIVLAFVILGGFSIGFYLIPALFAFVAVGALGDLQRDGLMARHLGYLLLAAVVQSAVMLTAIQFA